MRNELLAAVPLLLSLLGPFVALMILWTCRNASLSWWIGVPAAIAVMVAGIFAERAIERKYLPSRRSN
ncbi:hypothetical protein [Burkholderia pseudomallei]|uniref:hypothetical protein n=1 Tax=Burkholderia pseudomallei TaxID=28450 RepID=UPI000F25D4C8|nr:hypothetical protein [Burkholderia pseudomallei]VBQ36248.1 Uncharacterised protein [Burkholderia pseudomallei]